MVTPPLDGINRWMFSSLQHTPEKLLSSILVARLSGVRHRIEISLAPKFSWRVGYGCGLSLSLYDFIIIIDNVLSMQSCLVYLFLIWLWIYDVLYDRLIIFLLYSYALFILYVQCFNEVTRLAWC